jgi:hypothetical protein
VVLSLREKTPAVPKRASESSCDLSTDYTPYLVPLVDFKMSKTTKKPEAKPDDVEKEDGDKAEAEGDSKLSAEALKAKKAAEAVTDHHSEREGSDMASALAAERSLPVFEPKEITFTGTISSDDMAAIMEECDMTKEEADALLKRAGGNLEQALELFVTAQ